MKKNATKPQHSRKLSGRISRLNAGTTNKVKALIKRLGL